MVFLVILYIFLYIFYFLFESYKFLIMTTSVHLGLIAFVVSIICLNTKNVIKYYFLLFSYIFLFINPLTNLILTPMGSANWIEDKNMILTLLSTLVTCEVAIYGIMVSVSLIAIQISTESYSYRITNIFLKSSNFKLINFIYLSSITLNIGLLESISFLDIKINYFINYSYLSTNITLFAILSTPIYFYFVFKLLKPLNILDCLISNLDQIELSSKITSETKNDPIQPYIDVLIRTITRHDDKITIEGIELLKQKVNFILRRNVPIANSDILLIKLILSQFKELSSTAIANNRPNIAEHIVNSLRDLAIQSINNQNIVLIITKILGSIGCNYSNKYQRSLVYLVLKSIGKIGNCSEASVSEQAIASLGKIGCICAEKGMSEAYIASNCIAKICFRAINNTIKNKIWIDDLRESIKYLVRIAKRAAENESIGTASQTIFLIKDLGIKSKNLYFIENLIDDISSIKELALELNQSKLELDCERAIHELKSKLNIIP